MSKAAENMHDRYSPILKAWFSDALRRSAVVRSSVAMYYYVTGIFAGADVVKLSALATALRLTHISWIGRDALRRIKDISSRTGKSFWVESRLGVAKYDAESWRVELVKSLILKAPSQTEKGVLYISFESQWARLARHYDVSEVCRKFSIVGASSSSLPDVTSIIALAKRSESQVFVQISNPADMEIYSNLGEEIVPLPIMASDWIDPSFYNPKPYDDRQFDIVMVAGWARLKNHWLLFRALKRLDPNIRVALIGQDMEGRTIDDVMEEARAFGVEHQLHVIRNASPALVAQILCDSRVSVVLSRREGSSVVVAESFFADTPVIALADAHIGALCHINSSTGALTPAGALHDCIDVVLRNRALYSPRAWATRHISARQTADRLNSILREHVLARGAVWEKDIIPMCWRPDPIYLDSPEPDILDAYETLFRECGVKFRDFKVE